MIDLCTHVFYFLFLIIQWLQQFGQRESHIIHFGNTHEHGQLPLIVELSKRKEKKRL